MPSRIEIHITGLALCYFKNDYWYVAFLCDEAHQLNCKFAHAAGTFEEDLHDRHRKTLNLDFESLEIKPRDGEPYGDNSEVLFNMSAEYAHGADDPDTSKLRFRDRTGVETDLILMKVPQAILEVWKVTDNDYFVQEQTYSGAPVEIIGQVGSEVVIRFDVGSRAAMKLTDPNDPKYSRPISEFDPGMRKVVIEFDNHCHTDLGGCRKNDFLDLYDLVIDRVEDGERKFAAGQVKSTFFAGKRVEELREALKRMIPQQGNCDPVGSNPPPPGDP